MLHKYECSVLRGDLHLHFAFSLLCWSETPAFLQPGLLAFFLSLDCVLCSVGPLAPENWIHTSSWGTLTCLFFVRGFWTLVILKGDAEERCLTSVSHCYADPAVTLCLNTREKVIECLSLSGDPSLYIWRLFWGLCIALCFTVYHNLLDLFPSPSLFWELPVL